MLEPLKDRIGESHVKLAAWEQLCMSMRISDAWLLEDFSQAQGSLGFFCLDRQRDDTILARLDRFYATDGLCA